MKEKCVEEGMKLAQLLQKLGIRGAGVASASYEDYQRLSKEAEKALQDVDKMTCLSNDERLVIKQELTYLKEQSFKASFLYTSDAGARLLNILANPQFYTEYYKSSEPGRRKRTRENVRVEVWEERDRLHIGIQDKDTGDILISWWDDEARQMFEDGFFKREPGLQESVLEYAEDLGILKK